MPLLPLRLLLGTFLAVPAMSLTCLAELTVSDFDSVRLVTLTNARGMQVKVTNYGAIITAMNVPDRDGTLADVTLGHDRLAEYVNAIDRPYFGAVVGRYGNRISKGKFQLDGQEYTLPVNNEPNSLHGGQIGFDKVIWEMKPVPPNSVALSYRAKDGEQGYPGNLTAEVTYRLTDENEIEIEYRATTDKPTPVNLTQHAYFNLSGEGNGTILGHELMIRADQFTPVDATLIPTGELRSVGDTPFDFRTPKAIGRDIETENEQLKYGGGFDHNWILKRNTRSGLELAATLYEPMSGRFLEVWTTEPGVQFYSGNFLDGSLKGKSGQAYVRRGGLCLETQHFPDSPNHSHFPNTILRPGETWTSKTVWKFSTK